jgi:hypothetical protein
VTSEASVILGAAQAAMSTTRRKVAARQRQPNPAIDVSPERAASALVLWASQDAVKPQAYRDQGPLLVPQASQPRLYFTAAGALERPIDLSLEPTGSMIWMVENCTVQGQKRTMLLGAVRLENGDWSLFRQIAVKHGNALIFQTDPTWYHNRVKRSKQHNARHGN